MWQQTERLALIWVRITLALVACVAVVMTVYRPDSVQFKLAVVVAVFVDLLTIRGLCREWTWQARGCWWRFW
jgi:hypothetical protein